MKNMNIQDERILSERRKIQSRGYAWLVLMLLVSIIVQFYFMRAPFAQYAVEFFVLIGCGGYNIIANFKKGINIWNPRDDSMKQMLVSTLISAVLSVILFAVFSGDYQINNLAFYFISFIVFMFASRLIMTSLSNKKQARIDKELDDDDMFE